MSSYDKVLVIGSGIAGMTASLLLSKGGKQVTLVEKLPLIGGNTIKTGESFPNMECSTCLVSPVQQDILQDESINVLTVSEVDSITGEAGNFKVKIRKRARYVSLSACLGCGMCFPVCPVTQTNLWEEGLTEKKAIYVECAGSLPNVPVIDPALCLRLNGKGECNQCVEACMFGAIDFSEKDEIIEENFGAIIAAPGYSTVLADTYDNYGFGKYSGVYTAREMERVLAANGPTEGKIVMRNGEQSPESLAVIHCVGRSDIGYCSNVCCSYTARYVHFLKERLPEIKLYAIYIDLCLPDKFFQKLNDKTQKNAEYIYTADIDKIKISEESDKLKITYPDANEDEQYILVDMAVLNMAIKPAESIDKLTEILGIEKDEYGFLKASGSVETNREGIYIAGCAEGPKDIPSSVMQSEAAVGKVMQLLTDRG